MQYKNILSKVDHTFLAQTATWADIKKLCDEAIEYKTASICIPPAYVQRAKEYVSNRTKICTVIGFPNGYQTTEVKVFETNDAINNGADEIDMVINLGWLKDGEYTKIKNEIKKIKHTCGDRILKVIVETCVLSEVEKKKICNIVNESGADYIKTSTGFLRGGATFEDVKLFSTLVRDGIKIKAAGGISTLDDAIYFLEIGADRLGTSRIVRLARSVKDDNSDDSTY